MKKALITGITGWESSSLAEVLTGKGHEVRGLIRRSPSFSTEASNRLERLVRGTGQSWKLEEFVAALRMMMQRGPAVRGRADL